VIHHWIAEPNVHKEAVHLLEVQERITVCIEKTKQLLNELFATGQTVSCAFDMFPATADEVEITILAVRAPRPRCLVHIHHVGRAALGHKFSINAVRSDE